MRIIIADDHALFREALRCGILKAEPHAQVFLAGDFEEAHHIIDDLNHVDLVLLDYRMPGMKGFEGLRHLRESYPELRVALMSGLARSHQVRRALGMGACAYFPKTLPVSEMRYALRYVLDGGEYVPYDLDGRNILPSYYDDEEALIDPGLLKALTPRENDVLEFLCEGSTNQDIADALGLKLATIKLHVRAVCQKLGVKNRTQAALAAQEAGFPA